MGNKQLSQYIGSSISSARKRKGYTQKQLAEIIETQQPNISKIERGEYIPNVAFLKYIMDCLDTEVKIEFLPKV